MSEQSHISIGISIIALCVAALALFSVFTQPAKAPTHDDVKDTAVDQVTTTEEKPEEVKLQITNFEQCIAAGNPAMESYPRQCRDAEGNMFVENIGNGLSLRDSIQVTDPLPNARVSDTSFEVIGEAKVWYFEGSFSATLVDWDGKILDEAPATAQDDWMSEEFVPFKSLFEFDSPVHQDAEEFHFSRRGTIILTEANPAGLDVVRTLEIPVWFE